MKTFKQYHLKRLRDSEATYKDWNTAGQHDKKLKEIRAKIKKLASK